MIGNIIDYISVTNAFVGLIGVGLFVQIIIRIAYHFKLRRIAGGNAAKLANNPILSLTWLWTIGKAQASNRLLPFFYYVFDNYATEDSPNCVEINVTGGQRYLFTQDPEHMKTVLTGKFSDFGKGAEFHHVWKPFLGDSIFTTDGQQWSDSRGLIRPMFIKNRVSDLKIFEKWTNVMIKQFPASGQTVDIMDLFYRTTIDIITEFLLGHSVNSLEHPSSKFVQAFTDVQRWQTMLTVLIPIEKLIPRGQYLKSIKVLEDFVLPFIERTLALSPEELEKLGKSDSQFTFLHALANYTRDPKVIRDQLIAILLAGRDTTAATLSWTFYEVANYPEVWKKIREEVLQVIGPNREPSYDDLKHLKYVKNVLNETLRLYPAVPFNVRYALADSTLPASVPGQPDVAVVKGDAVFYAPIVMQRLDKLYPRPSKDFLPAKTFSPERWENWQPKAWQYIPFNGGPRICPGQNFALTEMAFLLVKMAQKFERVEYRGDWNEQYHKVEIVGTPGHPVKVALFEAEKN